MLYISRLKTFLISTIMMFATLLMPLHAFSASYFPSSSGNFLAGNQALKDMRSNEAASYFLNASETDWNNPRIIQRAFIALGADGRIEDAATLAQHLIEIDKNNELARLVLGTIALKERRYSSTLRQLENVKAGNFTTISAIILRAWALLGEKKTNAANALLDELSKAGLDDFSLFHRALMADVTGDHEQAIKYIARAYQNDSYITRITEAYARILANASRFKEAKSVILAYKSKGLSNPIIREIEYSIDSNIRPGKLASTIQEGAAEMYHGIGVALANEGRNELAMLFFRLGIYLNPKAQTITMSLAQLLEDYGLYEEANKIYLEMDSSSVLKITAMINIAQNLNFMDNREEAIRKLKNITITNPTNLDAISHLGDMFRYDKNYTEAIKAYTKALKIVGGERPQDWRFYYVRGISYERNNEWKKAEADFLKALNLNPGHPQVLNYLGYSWVDKGLNLKPALNLIRQAVKARPNDGYIVDSLGWAYYKLNKKKDAVKTLEEAVRLLPNDPEINDHLGDAYWLIGRKLEATYQWKIAIDVDELGDVTKRAEKKLKDAKF